MTATETQSLIDRIDEACAALRLAYAAAPPEPPPLRVLTEANRRASDIREAIRRSIASAETVLVRLAQGAEDDAEDDAEAAGEQTYPE